ncbi:MAG TPA: tetratricopeptide repeat protein [Bryobacteraceae bacterium]|nr:tetratricopeptide repeat protein [Bryobacteraceae bacterium]
MATGKGTRPKGILVWAAVLAAVVVGGGIVWRSMRPRAIRLWVVSDYSFRERHDWDTVLDARFRAVNRIFQGTGVEWQVVNAEHLDPAANIASLDQRRLELERREDAPVDVVISMTGQGEGDRLGSINPFSHAGLVVDFPQQSEEQNTLNLAHDLALLFAAPVEPAGSGTVMALPPREARFAPRTAALIRQLRDYDFAAGIDSLKDRWEHRAVQALADAYTTPSPKPLAHAYVTVALTLEAERHSAEAVPDAREAVKADPQSVDARLALAHALMDDLQPQAATRELNDAVRLFPKNASLHGFLGTVLGTQADTDEALQELRTAVALDPGNANFPVAIGSILVSQTAHLDEAMAEFQKAARLDPHLAVAQEWLRRMDTLSAQAKDDLAATLKKERETPQDADVHYRLGVDEARLGRLDDARQELQKAVALNPRNGRAYADLAAMDFYGNDYEAARRHVNAARAAGFEPPSALVMALERKEKEKGQSPVGRVP